MYTVKEASEKLGLSEGQVRRLLRKDEIKGEKLGRDWLVLSLEYQMFSVNEAAQKLKLGPSQIRRLLATGKIKGKKFGRDWVVLSLDYTRKRKSGIRTKISKN